MKKWDMRLKYMSLKQQQHKNTEKQRKPNQV